MTRDDVRSVMAQMQPDAILADETDLLTCGLDSIALASVIPAAEHMFAVQVNDEQIIWRKIRTVGAARALPNRRHVSPAG
jgi:acyl carrier protein